MLPTYEMIIEPNENSDVEVSFMALVDKPAIEKNFLAFKSHSLEFKADPERMIISGPAMVADSLIYRRDENGEYNVFFSKETISQIAQKFFKKDYHKNINLFHDTPVSDVTIFESFVSDASRGIQPMKGFEDLPDGSWFISAKVENPEVWNRIKAGELKGFSVEGVFSYIKSNRTDKHNAVFNKKDIMATIQEMFNEFKEKFFGEPSQNAPVTMAKYQLADGTEVECDKLESGGMMTIAGAPAMPGDYQLADGTKLTVGDGGVISAVGAAEPMNDYSKNFAAIDQKFAAYETKFTEQSATIKQLSESFSKTNETIVHLVGIVEKMAQSATAEPVGASQNNFSEAQKSKEEKRKELSEALQKIRNKN